MNPSKIHWLWGSQEIKGTCPCVTTSIMITITKCWRGQNKAENRFFSTYMHGIGAIQVNFFSFGYQFEYSAFRYTYSLSRKIAKGGGFEEGNYTHYTKNTEEEQWWIVLSILRNLAPDD